MVHRTLLQLYYELKRVQGFRNFKSLIKYSEKTKYASGTLGRDATGRHLSRDVQQWRRPLTSPVGDICGPSCILGDIRRRRETSANIDSHVAELLSRLRSKYIYSSLHKKTYKCHDAFSISQPLGPAMSSDIWQLRSIPPGIHVAPQISPNGDATCRHIAHTQPLYNSNGLT